MNRNRAPRGIPTGGQFVATPRSEAGVSLTPPLREINQARKDNREMRTALEKSGASTGPVERRGLNFDDVTDSIVESRLAGVLEAAVDDLQERHQAPIDETTGSFVDWGQLVPKFLRRK